MAGRENAKAQRRQNTKCIWTCPEGLPTGGSGQGSRGGGGGEERNIRGRSLFFTMVHFLWVVEQCGSP